MSDFEKPECYGDYEEYDPSTDRCEGCAYVNGCGIRSMRNKKDDYASTRPPIESSRYDRYNSSKSSSRRAIDKYKESKKIQRKKSQEIVEQEPEEDDTFIDILRHNASLEAVQAVFDEISNSIRHIPRKTYTNFRRKKR